MRDFEPTARVVADSVSATTGQRITTLHVRLHHFVLAEFTAHPALSCTCVPIGTVADAMRDLADEPAVPMLWPAERRGTQGGPPLPTDRAIAARQTWLNARDQAVIVADAMTDIGLHRSVVNRLLEPFAAHTLVVTATDWRDFYTQYLPLYDLREPLLNAEIVAAASAMRTATQDSTPEKLSSGEWHLPYLNPQETTTLPSEQAQQISAARCARASSLTDEGTRDIDADFALYQRLISASPPRLSPLAHVATPTDSTEPATGTFTGWQQLRHTLTEDAS